MSVEGSTLEESGGKQMNTEERTTVIELNDRKLQTVTGGDKKSGGTTTASPPKEYLQYKMTEVFISSFN
jgi:bacteriocin-like protein